MKLKIKVYGNVQGVGFRYFAQDKARKFGVKGFAKNEKDGSVCIEAEGKANNVNKFLEWCKAGPPSSRVKKVETESLQDITNYQDFKIE